MRVTHCDRQSEVFSVDELEEMEGCDHSVCISISASVTVEYSRRFIIRVGMLWHPVLQLDSSGDDTWTRCTRFSLCSVCTGLNSPDPGQAVLASMARRNCEAQPFNASKEVGKASVYHERPAAALATGSEFLNFQNTDSIFVEESKSIVRLIAGFVNKKGVTELATN
ncbi:hypothetical protein PIB30_080566 [Stylosanthes scabra]|uniref:Uncharacterized protein n=1 Tax=Stylosanthes scabra TaxID=79078 RepID=A0ABU6XSF1_9FABA|nr:hypothetical protein [Stylosanthes scabra]